jgi:hypothetical protein
MDVIRNVAIEAPKAPELINESDHVRYDGLAQAALRDLIHVALARLAKSGPPRNRHSQITIDTKAPGAEALERVTEKYADRMTIIHQHKFWSLSASDQHFEMALSFDGSRECARMAFTSFQDPSMQFTMHLDEIRPAEDRIP